MAGMIETIRTELAASLVGSRLDRELALGASPESSAVLRARARQLARAVRRRRIAARLESIVDAVERSKRVEGAGLIYDHQEIEKALPLLLQLVERLREPASPNPQGVAIVSWLVGDSDSPIFAWGRRVPHGPESIALSGWADRALRKLHAGGGSPL